MTQISSSPLDSAQNLLEMTLFNDTLHPDEAREILLEIFNRKINFHTIKNLSSHVNYLKENESERNKINALKMELDGLLEIIAQAKAEKTKLYIQSEIRISKAQP